MTHHRGNRHQPARLPKATIRQIRRLTGGLKQPGCEAREEGFQKLGVVGVCIIAREDGEGKDLAECRSKMDAKIRL